MWGKEILTCVEEKQVTNKIVEWKKIQINLY